MRCQELANRRAARWKRWHPDRDGQAERSLCPAEERTAHRSPFARRITSFPGMEDSVWVKGRVQRGREPPGAEGKKRKGETGRRKSPIGLPETCHPGRVGHPAASLPPSLSPSLLFPLLAACQQARRARGQELLACFPVVTKRQGRRNTFLHPTHSLNSCPDREQGDALLPHPPFSLPPHSIPRCDVSLRGVQGSCVVWRTWSGVGGSPLRIALAGPAHAKGDNPCFGFLKGSNVQRRGRT